MVSYRVFLAIASCFGATAVAAGAFASHGLKGQLSERMLSVFETGVRYQMYHALALMAVALWLLRVETGLGWLNAAGWGFVLGVVLFSGSLYGLSLSGVKILGAVAPLGGAALIVGWGCLLAAALTFK